MLGYYAQGIIYCWEVKGQGRGQTKEHLISYNFMSNCHRDFKLDSCFSLWKAAWNMTLASKSSPKVKIFEKYQLTPKRRMGFINPLMFTAGWGL